MSDQLIQQPRVTFVIPTLDAGHEFAELLDRVAQSLPGESLEIIVIDSGSQDATVAIAQQRGVSLHEIPAVQFNHGRTRNLGVSLASGEFVAFLSQDALPRDRDWLVHLLAAFDDERVAGSYSRVVAGREVSPLVARSVEADLTNRDGAIDQRVDDPDAWLDLSPRERRVRSHFSNVASCVRRSVALAHPFPERDFGEDIAWSQSVMLDGYTIGYRPESVVVHAHASGLLRDYRRYRSDATLHRDLFGEHMNALQCARTFAAEVGRDMRALISGSPARGVRYAFYSPILRAAQAAGRWAGFKSSGGLQGMPDTAASRLSRRLLPQKASVDQLRTLFDPEFYLAQLPNREVPIADPIDHYLKQGDAAGLWPHPLFDPDYYSEQRPAISRMGGARLSHYLVSGGREKVNPHRLFDALWYSTQEGCAPEAGEPSLVHYLQHGDAANRWPHPLFDPLYYGKRHPQLETAGGGRLIDFAASRIGDGKSPHALFDPAWMLASDPDIQSRDMNLLSFYEEHGEPAGLLPNPFFDPSWYRADNPDLAEWKLLLYHYAHHGTKERRRPCALFDAPWYEDRYPDVVEFGLHPIVHYRDVGDALDYWPNALFDPTHYGRQFQGIERAGGERLLHYQANFRESDADPHPLFSTCWYRAQGYQSINDERTSIVHYREQGEADGCWPHPLFDPKTYAEQVAEVPSRGPCLLVHYYFVGAREGYDPNSMFDGKWYLEEHPELRSQSAASIAPLVHYLEGQNRGDVDAPNPHPLFDAAWYREQNLGGRDQDLEPLQHFLHQGADQDLNPHPRFDSARYRATHELGATTVPIFHYLTHRDAAGAFLEPFFNAEYYKATYATSGLSRLEDSKDAFAHYLERGYNRGYRPGPLFEFCRSFFINDDPGLCESPSNPMAGVLEGTWALPVSERNERLIEFRYHAEPMASVVIAAHGPVPYTLACLRALTAATTQVTFEVVLVIDGPVEHTSDPFAAIENVTVVRNEVAQGFLRASNAGARFARGTKLVFLNNDTLPCDGWLDALIATDTDFPNAGIVASRLLGANGRLQEAGSIVFNDGSAANYGYGEDPDAPPFAFAREADYASAAALMIDRSRFEAMGAFDERFSPAFYEDTDLAFRVRDAGLDVICQPASTVVHFGGVNYARESRTGRNPQLDANRKTFIDRWADVLPEYESKDVAPAQAIRRGVRGHILVLDATTPTPTRDSGSLRMFNMLRVLRRMHYRVTFVPADLSHPEREVARMRAAGIEVHAPPHIESVAAFLEEHGPSFDLCLLSRPQTAGRYLAAAKSCCPNATVVYDTVDLHFLRRERQIALLGESDVSQVDAMRESLACATADRVLVVSEFDRARSSAEWPAAKVHVVSNVHEGIPTTRSFDERSGILFIGGFRHTPNVDGMLWFAENVMPLVRARLPEAVLHVVGSDMPDEIRALASPSISIEGYVEDVTPLFDSCLLSVAPLRFGSGVKGKVNQSMSHGLPCVATSIAAEGLEASHGRDILVADDAQAFAREIIRLHEDPACWRTLSQGSLDNIAEHFSMATAESRLQELLEACGLAPQPAAERSTRAASR